MRALFSMCVPIAWPVLTDQSGCRPDSASMRVLLRGAEEPILLSPPVSMSVAIRDEAMTPCSRMVVMVFMSSGDAPESLRAAVQASSNSSPTLMPPSHLFLSSWRVFSSTRPLFLPALVLSRSNFTWSAAEKLPGITRCGYVPSARGCMVYRSPSA